MTETPHILALELSSRIGSVGLGTAETWLGEEAIEKKARHSDDLMPAIDRLMKRHGVTRSQLSEVDVAIGPGGFTGLRLAVTTAKMLGHALNPHLVAVPTAEVVAANAPVTGKSLGVVLAIKHDHAWFTPFRCQEEGWIASHEGHLRPIPEILNAGHRSILYACQPPDMFIEACTQAGIELREATFSAEGCWRAGQIRAREGRFIDPLEIQPEYARPPEAVRLWPKTSPKRKS